MQQENQANEYKGFSLFNDITDVALRNRNRAVVLANIAEEYTNASRRINPKGASMIIGYFDKVPVHEREDVKNRFVEAMNQRGYAIAE